MEVISFVCITFLFRSARGWSSDKSPSLFHKHRILSSTPHRPTQRALLSASYCTVPCISSILIHFPLLCLFSRTTDDGYILQSSTTTSKLLPASSDDFLHFNDFWRDAMLQLGLEWELIVIINCQINSHQAYKQNGLDTKYPAWRLSWYSSVLPGRRLDNTSIRPRKLRTRLNLIANETRFWEMEKWTQT